MLIFVSRSLKVCLPVFFPRYACLCLFPVKRLALKPFCFSRSQDAPDQKENGVISKSATSTEAGKDGSQGAVLCT
jgi:hypothetical protein